MEVAGLVLGALPVAITAVGGYLEGLKVIENYGDYAQTLKGIHRNIFIQQQQFEATLEGIGLVKPTVQEVQQKIRELKPESYPQFINILEHMGSITLLLLEKLDVDSNGKPKWTDLDPSRASWEWRRVKRSFGHKYRKDLFDELQYWNTALRNCLGSKREVPSDDNDPLACGLVRRFDFKSCSKARETVQIIHEVLAVAWSKSCTDPQHPSNVELTWQDTGLNETRQLYLSIPESGESLASKHWQKVFISVDTKLPTPPSHCAIAPSQLSTTRFTLQPMLNVPEKHKVHKAHKADKANRFRNLVSSISKQTKPPGSGNGIGEASSQLDCLGPSNNNAPKSQLVTELCSLTKQEEWNGHLLYLKTGAEAIITMKKVSSPCPRFLSIPLESVISKEPSGGGKGNQVVYTRLSRKERLGIAAAAAWAVLVLCGTSWLEERRLGIEDITLLVEVPTQGSKVNRPNLPKTSPALVHSFTSQKATSNKQPEVQHATNYQDSQIRHKTLFALGVLLIELGLNKTFNQVRSDVNPQGPACERSVQSDYAIANQVIEMETLELELGESYAHAVQRCIQCHFLGSESTQTFLHSGFRTQFFNGVVAPVQATFDAYVTSVHSL
ncbi:hypothetical protein F5Y12DRAFT_744164 [Xylaria sp. FL1777]|nr:hypothetical protein F5Y12DRAFT_744164 [Xylaria sp. FL1777]